jgi:hypothetical protein
VRRTLFVGHRGQFPFLVGQDVGVRATGKQPAVDNLCRLDEPPLRDRLPSGDAIVENFPKLGISQTVFTDPLYDYPIDTALLRDGFLVEFATVVIRDPILGLLGLSRFHCIPSTERHTKHRL